MRAGTGRRDLAVLPHPCPRSFVLLPRGSASSRSAINAEETLKFWKLRLSIMAGSPNEDSEGSRITYVKGDLFACPKTDSLAHCISEDCRMGAGIAVLFKKKFGGVQELLNQQKKSGEVAVLKRDGRYIYYLDWMWS
ncbi:ADP-ribose glycohydrolase OARD1 isoform X2 [Mirounga leonina]|uniref:ADP-ribose glycohydrolase OARD1 isoform X2 n=1 Tax=Mirounga leonina TaxID=9715 RepID=UPI00156C2EA7|nr:ADP-ribose glycohydrolase OARD1 isoform X2 [Mirounga leonina]